MKSKKKFLEVFKEKLGNISIACRTFGIERGTFYNWYNCDPAFKKAADDIKEIRKDFIENAFINRVNAGDTAAIIFGLKTICKDRGYVEKVEQDVTIRAEQPLFGDYDDEDEEKEC